MGEPDAKQPPATLTPLAFEDLPGWAADDHAASFSAFRRGAAALDSHPPKPRLLGTDPVALTELLRLAGKLPEDLPQHAARDFFERHFLPANVVPVDGSGFFTGYYEPEVSASRTRTSIFTVPLLAPPADLVEIEAGSQPGLPADFRFARRTNAGFEEHPDRGAIMAGALNEEALAIAWLADPVDAFFIHIQGAARLRVADGSLIRVTYAAKSGHPYTPIGRVLIERGALPHGGATMPAIRRWLAENPDHAPEILATNRSYIFFREAPVSDPLLGPIAAAKVPLTAGRSLAVDRLLHTFHAPVWVETTLADGTPLQRLMIAQDTGSAIVGPARGDIFFGSGDEAGEKAGGLAFPGRFVMLLPKAPL